MGENVVPDVLVERLVHLVEVLEVVGFLFGALC